MFIEMYEQLKQARKDLTDKVQQSVPYPHSGNFTVINAINTVFNNLEDQLKSLEIKAYENRRIDREDYESLIGEGLERGN